MFRERSSINNAECHELLGIDLQRASYLLKKLAAMGALKREGMPGAAATRHTIGCGLPRPRHRTGADPSRLAHAVS
jgi:hypothetical protein